MDTPERQLEPLPYHVEVRDYLKAQERALWDWFASARAQAEHVERLRLELLKSSYRLAKEDHPALYAQVEQAKARLGLDVPVTLYQAQGAAQLNAALYCMPAEGHVVFSGPLLSLLDEAERLGVIGHELAHFRLWSREGGEFLVADRLLQAAASDPRAGRSHVETARRYQLYTEVFADRGSLAVAGDLGAVVSGLVKVQTGLSEVSAASYLQQAEEIFASGTVTAEGGSHPEAFIRARALALWQEQGALATMAVRSMIEGAPGLEELDLPGQVAWTRATRHLLGRLLQPRWFHTPAVLAHARLFFPDFDPAEPKPRLEAGDLGGAAVTLREYLAWVLLDFAAVDRELEDLPLAAAWELSRGLGLEEVLDGMVTRELKLRARDWRRVKERAPSMLQEAEVGGG